MVSNFLNRIAQSYFLGTLIDYFAPDQKGIEELDAYLSALGVILCSTASVLLVYPTFMGQVHTGMKTRVAVCSLIYRKVSPVFFIICNIF